MNLLMISGDRSILEGRKGAFWYLLEEFGKYWERIDVICPWAKGEARDIPCANVVFHSCPRGLWFQPLWIWKKGRELIKAHSHSVVSVHEYPPFYNGKGAWLLHRSTGVPYALEIHHVVGHPIAASISEKVGYLLSRCLLRFDAMPAAAVRTVNLGTKRLLSQWGMPSEKIHIVPSFYLDRERLTPNSLVEKQYDVVCCGRLVVNKGLAEVVDAIAQIPEATLLLIGDGPLRKSLESQVQRLGIEDRVTFAGWLSENTEVYNALQSARMLVMNSKSEGGPRVALEAMALGLPIISTNVGVMPDVIEDRENGLFTTGTVSDLKEKIHTLRDYHMMRLRLSEEARRVVEKYDRTVLIHSYAEFLQSLAR